MHPECVTAWAAAVAAAVEAATADVGWHVAVADAVYWAAAVSLANSLATTAPAADAEPRDVARAVA
jgi:hypothetical protein